MESRLEVLFVNSVMEVLREEIVGLVNTREAGLETSDVVLEIPSPVGDMATSSIVSRRRSKGFGFPIESRSDDLPCSADVRNAFGLI